MEAGLDASRITFLPWGVDLASCRPDGPVADLRSAGVDASVPVVLSLRALEPMYRIGDIVKAWPAVLPHMPTAMLVIANDGSLRSELEQRVGALAMDASVRFIGRVPEAEVPSLLRRAAAYVSMSEVDGTSVTLLQAMACGAPVVVSDIPGNRAWVDGVRTGRLVPIGADTALAEAIVAAAGGDTAVPAGALVRERADWQANIARLAEALRRA